MAGFFCLPEHSVVTSSVVIGPSLRVQKLRDSAIPESNHRRHPRRSRRIRRNGSKQGSARLNERVHFMERIESLEGLLIALGIASIVLFLGSVIPDTPNYRLSSQGLFHSHDKAVESAQSFAHGRASREKSNQLYFCSGFIMLFIPGQGDSNHNSRFEFDRLSWQATPRDSHTQFS